MGPRAVVSRRWVGEAVSRVERKRKHEDHFFRSQESAPSPSPPKKRGCEEEGYERGGRTMRHLLVSLEGLVESQTEPEGRDTAVETPQRKEADSDSRPLASSMSLSFRERLIRKNVDV